MIKHIVFWRFKESAEGASKEANLQKAKSLFEGLRGKIKEIDVFEVGINFDASADAVDLVLYSEFPKMEDLRSYQKHPEHMKVVEFIGKVKSEKRIADYEI
jgi:hypothetical protein